MAGSGGSNKSNDDNDSNSDIEDIVKSRFRESLINSRILSHKLPEKILSRGVEAMPYHRL